MPKRKNIFELNSNKKFKSNDSSEDDSDSDSDSGNHEVWRDGNHIFFYADVKVGSVARLNRFLFEINKENQQAFSFPFKSKFNQDPEYPPIYLHIKSDGGCVESSLSSIDLIMTSNCPVYTIIEGYAASAATMISIVGKKRFIHKNAHMLIHQMSAGFWGKMEEIKDEIKNINKFEKVIFKIYKKHAKIPDRKFKKILKHDLWWSSKKCHKYKLVDQII